jgi:hypothetical protein
MAPCRPTGTLLNKAKTGMIYPANHQGIRSLLGEVALQAQRWIRDLQHLVIGTAVRVMTNRATFP